MKMLNRMQAKLMQGHKELRRKMDKRRKIHLFSAAAWLVFLSMVTMSWASETTSIGEGRTRQEAINNGIRVAVEQALGTMAKSDSRVNNGKPVWDHIASAGAGFVKNYNVLLEGKDPIRDVYKVKLTVNVDDYKIKGAVDDFLNDPLQLQTFQQTKFDERKVVVVYVGPRFHQGMALDPGRWYHAEVSGDGYKSQKMWVKLEPGGDATLRFSLERKSVPQVETSTKQTTKHSTPVTPSSDEYQRDNRHKDTHPPVQGRHKNNQNIGDPDTDEVDAGA